MEWVGVILGRVMKITLMGMGMEMHRSMRSELIMNNETQLKQENLMKIALDTTTRNQWFEQYTLGNHAYVLSFIDSGAEFQHGCVTPSYTSQFHRSRWNWS
ncbi:uncharacterized protein LOC113335005 [Papaver somniferum]|uniref:uncharacterized protein LOC113335005 n=1 Tax=Papaver somniferum TaxID=3469 RepID=UPI000E6FAE7D|nr:uncharacterized protein LOC113335005 [Papaver somniferum]